MAALPPLDARRWSRINAIGDNGDTWFSPWDIYTIRRIYDLTPNGKPDFTPAPDYP